MVAGFGAMGGIMEMIVIGYLISSAQCDFNMTDEDKGLLGAITYIGEPVNVFGIFEIIVSKFMSPYSSNQNYQEGVGKQWSPKP